MANNSKQTNHQVITEPPSLIDGGFPQTLTSCLYVERLVLGIEIHLGIEMN